MDYRKILSEQSKKLNNAYKYWPYYLYHFSDIHNIVNVLEEGIILSRNESIKRGIMLSDNASEQVIGKTKADALNYARLYFRPLTPEQYHSEGYKPESIRNQEINASCPVPVFLILDADAILNMRDVYFVEQGIAGAGHKLCSGYNEFQNLNFEKIYDNRGYSGDQWSEAKKYRMSEVICKRGFPLDNILKGIVCRSVAERDTLLWLLRERNENVFNQYKNIIYVKADFECFYYNGLFVNNVNVHGSVLDIDFDTPAERKYEDAQVAVHIHLTMCDGMGWFYVMKNRIRLLTMAVHVDLKFL